MHKTLRQRAIAKRQVDSRAWMSKFGEPLADVHTLASVVNRRGGATCGAVNEDLNLQLGAAVVFTSTENGREEAGTSRRAVNGNLSSTIEQMDTRGLSRNVRWTLGRGRAKSGSHSRTYTRGRASSTEGVVLPMEW